MEANPSSKPKMVFNKKIIFLIALVLVGAGALLFFSEEEIFGAKKQASLDNQNPKIQELLKTDTDRDGILDWEEALWGTDKNNTATFGAPDLEYVEQKKTALDVEQVQNDKSLNETEIFAQEFFATYTAMRNSGQANESVNAFSSLLGERIGNPNLPDTYSKNQLKKADLDTPESQMTYYSKIENIFNRYVEFGIGDEVEIVNNGLISYTEKGQNADYSALQIIGDAYKNFAKEMASVTVPESILDYHWRIINSAHNTGVSVINMTKAIEDPIIGIGGVTQYEQYSNELYTAVGELEEFIMNSQE